MSASSKKGLFAPALVQPGKKCHFLKYKDCLKITSKNVFNGLLWKALSSTYNFSTSKVKILDMDEEPIENKSSLNIDPISGMGFMHGTLLLGQPSSTHPLLPISSFTSFSQFTHCPTRWTVWPSVCRFHSYWYLPVSLNPVICAIIRHFVSHHFPHVLTCLLLQPNPLLSVT